MKLARTGGNLYDSPVGFFKRTDVHSVQHHVRENIEYLKSYIEFTYPEESWRGHYRDIMEDPYVARTVIENWVTPEPEKYRMITEHLAFSEFFVLLVLGDMGQRKSVDGWGLAREVHDLTGKPVYSIGREPLLPWDGVKPAKTIMDVPPDAIVVWDELGQEANSREAMTKLQRKLPAEFALTRQKGHTFIGIVQNSSIADTGILKNVTGMMFKPLAMMQSRMERGGVGDIIRQWYELVPDDPRESLLVSRDLPPLKFDHSQAYAPGAFPWFWERDMSRHYALGTTVNAKTGAKRGETPEETAARKAQAVQEAALLRDADPGEWSYPKIADRMAEEHGLTYSREWWRKEVEATRAPRAEADPASADA